MKTTFLSAFFILLTLTIASCSKEDQGLSPKGAENPPLQALAAQYHLQRTNNAPSEKELNFPDTKSFQQFLESNHNLSSGADLGEVMHPLATPGTSMIDGGSSLVATTVNAGITHYSGQLNFPGLRSASFPSVMPIGWSQSQVEHFDMINVGANYGSYRFIPTTEVVSGNGILIKGTYVETYGFNGIFTYDKLWNFTLNATFGSGSLTATASFMAKL